ncbi:hypothetical protein JTB14_000564 [Gonioctena quinquepunctata]|nr:hypothetical protein JTB14_000564 [Gonioctena quinquepunctata]
MGIDAEGKHLKKIAELSGKFIDHLIFQGRDELYPVAAGRVAPAGATALAAAEEWKELEKEWISMNCNYFQFFPMTNFSIQVLE